MSDAESAPLLNVTGPLATITLNRPGKRNRLENEDLQTLLDCFAQIQADPSIRVLLLTARVNQPQPVFCAGYNVQQLDAQDGGTVFARVPDALERLNAVTLCALGGSVFGGATDLALACDLRVGVRDMVLRMPAAALGLHYYPSGLRRYVARLGLQFAKRVFLTARDVTAQELLAAGYLDQLVDAGELDSTVQDLARHLCSLAPLALQGMKQSLNALGDLQAGGADAPADVMGAIAGREARCQVSEDFAEGRAAFAARRPAVFVGR